MNSGDIFGEITYLFGGGATVSIVADDDVRVYIIDKTSLQGLFSSKPDLAGKFYKFLAMQIGRRVLPKHLTAEMEAQRRKTRSSSLASETNEFLETLNGTSPSEFGKKTKRRKSFSKKYDLDENKYTRLGIPQLELPFDSAGQLPSFDTPRPNRPSSRSLGAKSMQKVASNPTISLSPGIVTSRKASFSLSLKEGEEDPDWMKKLKQKKRLNISFEE
jgi:hypothetical protein